MDDVTAMRAVHVLAVIHWIGGVAFVTAVILPLVIATGDRSHQLALFEKVESRFSAQARISVPLAGLSGLYMADRLDAWPRFLDPAGWWLAAMALLWAVFMIILFVLEPFVLRRFFQRRVAADPAGAFRLVQRVHWVLLAASLTVSAGAVLGAHGMLG